MSNPAAQINKETSERLIKYLIKHQHWSPLEMANATLEIDTTRDIAHQIVRHRSFSFQEFSQRYANPEEQGDMFEYSEARLQDEKNRQNSIKTDDGKLQQGTRYTHKNCARSMYGETRILRTIERPPMRSKQEYRYTGPRNPHDQLGNNSVILPNNKEKPTHTSGRILQIRNPRHQKRNKALKHGI